MKTLFTADTHFSHRNIIKYCNRPFTNVTEMNEQLIANWNAVVNPTDIVYHLGDVAFCCTMEEALAVMKQLNGIKHLIVGNHDKLALEMNSIRPGTWTSIQDVLETTVNNQRIIMNHYAQRVWHHCYKGTWHLYGHTHAELPDWGKSTDVGVDVKRWNYSPVTFNQLKLHMDTLPNVHEIYDRDKWDKTGNS